MMSCCKGARDRGAGLLTTRREAEREKTHVREETVMTECDTYGGTNDS